MFLRCCQDDFRSPTLVEKPKTRLNSVAFTHYKVWFGCGGFTLATDSCPAKTLRLPTDFRATSPGRSLPPFNVYQHSLMMRFNQGVLPNPESRAYRYSIESVFLSCALSTCRKEAISQCSQCHSLHIACLSFSCSSLFCRHGPFIGPNAKLFYRSIKFHSVFAPVSTISDNCLFLSFCFTHPDAGYV